MFVVNAGTARKATLPRIAAAASEARARSKRVDDNALLALQGPEAVAVLETVRGAMPQLAFMHYAPFQWGEEQLLHHALRLYR